MTTIHHRPVLIGPSPCRYSSCTTLTPLSSVLCACALCIVSCRVVAVVVAAAAYEEENHSSNRFRSRHDRHPYMHHYLRLAAASVFILVVLCCGQCFVVSSASFDVAFVVVLTKAPPTHLLC